LSPPPARPDREDWAAGPFRPFSQESAPPPRKVHLMVGERRKRPAYAKPAQPRTPKGKRDGLRARRRRQGSEGVRTPSGPPPDATMVGRAGVGRAEPDSVRGPERPERSAEGVGLSPPSRCRVAGWSRRRRFRIVMNVPPAALQGHLTAFDRCAARLLPSEPERPVGGGAARSRPFGRTLNHCNARRLPGVRVELLGSVNDQGHRLVAHLVGECARPPVTEARRTVNPGPGAERSVAEASEGSPREIRLPSSGVA
jgi:hypothetical protein